jgi:hypothetical protein
MRVETTMNVRTFLGMPVIVSEACPPDQVFVGYAKVDFVKGKLVDVHGVKVVRLANESLDRHRG